MLPKHPDQYSDEELETWVRHLVNDRVSEGPRLDYKATIALEGKEKQRLEAAKDVSSFANEIGGTIIYGVPEDKQSDEVAVPRKPYGIKPIADLESRLENIYVDSIAPRLPEWRIRKVELTEYAGNVVYVVWTPESWIGVHMVERYGDRRYYRRGQLCAVSMSEYEVRQRYERLSILQSAVDDFLNSRQVEYIGELFPQDQFASHYVACPTMLFADRVDFTSLDMREWLEANPYQPWQWIPSAYGVRTTKLPEQREPHSYSEIYTNAAICHWDEALIHYDEANDMRFLAYMAELEEIREFLQFACRFYEKIQYFGPLHFRIRIRIENLPKPILWLPRVHRRSAANRRLITHDGDLSIDFTEPSNKLLENPNLILKEIADRMFQAFGLWEADCFDEHLKLKRK